MSRVAVVMGSESDLPVAERAAAMLRDFEVSYELRVISAHRTPHKAIEFSSEARERGIQIIIAAAGKAAHLAGILASCTSLPVIGVPVKSSTMDGLDSLLSTVQMPAGIPVATVAINGAENAALLALRILALGDKRIAFSLEEYRMRMEEVVNKADRKINRENSQPEG